MDEVETLLRRLALNDEWSLQRIMVSAQPPPLQVPLAPKVQWLVRLGALVALGSPASAVRATVDHALDAGASKSELAGVLVTVAPVVGLARVVASAPTLAAAIGFDPEADQ